MILIYWLIVTFDTKTTFELGFQSSFSMAWYHVEVHGEYFMIDRFFGGAFGGVVLPVLEYCSVVLCSAADSHLKLLDRVVNGDSFLTVGYG